MSKFIKYSFFKENGVKYDAYIAADTIDGVATAYIEDENGRIIREKENACIIRTREGGFTETANTKEEIMAQLAPEMVYGGERRLSPQFIYTRAFLAALDNLATVYLKSADEADKTNDEYQKAFCRGKAFAIKQVIAMAERWQDKPTEEE